jgi:hypothetical protein
MSNKRVLLIVLTLAGCLAADVRTDIAGQAVVSVAVWAVMLYLLDGVEPDLRCGLMACLTIATAGEIFLSLGWGLYAYRLGNIPLFVPPGHVLLLLLGLSLARRMPEAAANAVIGFAALYSLAAAAAGVDTLGAVLFLVFAAASVAMPAQRRLYASTFLLSLALELYGTWLGSWTWAREVPGTALVTTNPPGAAGAFYCALDALTALATRGLTPLLQSSPIVFTSTPTLSISTSTVSPGFIQTGGLRRAPTPPGVPVTITSPGSRVVKVEMYSISFGILKIICSVVACCMRSPFRRHDSVICVPAGISSAVTSQGPKPPVLAKFLPAVHWMVWRCQSRTEPSL